MDLIDILNAAWENTIDDFKKGEICSERHLQSLLFTYLKRDNNFNNKYKLFVEPKISTISKNSEILGLIPDILITNNEYSLELILELKYVPFDYPEYQKDESTFKKFLNAKQNGEQLYLLSDLDGDWDKTHPFSISKNLKYVFGAYGKKESVCFDKNKWDSELKNLSILSYKL